MSTVKEKKHRMIKWDVWDGKTTHWVETSILYSDVTEKILKDGISVFKEEHGFEPDTLIISTADSKIMFELKRIANKVGLSLIVEPEVEENRIVIVNLPPSGGGETIDDEDLVEYDYLELDQFRKVA